MRRKTSGSMTGRYQPRLSIFAKLDQEMFDWYAISYGDLADNRSFILAIAYGATFRNALRGVARTQGRSPLEVATGYSIWQSGTL